MKLKLEQYLKERHTRQTAQTYLFNIDVFLLRNPDANKLLYSDINNYLVELRKQGKAVNTVLAAIKKYYDFLLDAGIRDDHPCRNIRLRDKKKPVQIQDLFLPDELELLFTRENRYKHLELRNKVVISLLVYQGLTSAEVVNLDLKDIDLDSGNIYVRGGRKLAARTLELKPNQVLMFQKYIDTSRRELIKCTSTKLVISQRGTAESVDGINSMIEPLKQLFPDRNLNPSTIRQSVIANLLNHYKKPLEAVQLFAGHKWPSTTLQYKSKNINEQRELINKVHPLR